MSNWWDSERVELAVGLVVIAVGGVLLYVLSIIATAAPFVLLALAIKWLFF